MSLPEHPVRVIDYHQSNAANSLLPEPSVLSSSGWDNLHLELFQQPKFDIAEHQHTMHVIAYASGEQPSSGERWLDGTMRRETRNSGDIALIPAGISHRCNWNTSVQFMVLAIEPVLLQQVGQEWVNPDRIELMPQFMMEPDPLIQEIILALKHEVDVGGLGGYLLMDSLKTALAIHLLRHYCITSPRLSTGSGGLSLAKFALVRDYIHNHLQQDVKLSDLAAIAQMSPYHFLRLFKQHTGTTPHQYILRYRIDRAAELLRHSDLSIAEIAARVGFNDQSHLTRYFKRRVGMTPKQFLQAKL